MKVCLRINQIYSIESCEFIYIEISFVPMRSTDEPDSLHLEVQASNSSGTRLYRSSYFSIREAVLANSSVSGAGSSAADSSPGERRRQ